MTAEQVLELVTKILTEVPEAVEGLGNVASHLFNGNPEEAAREARLVAETVGIKKAARAAYETS